MTLAQNMFGNVQGQKNAKKHKELVSFNSFSIICYLKDEIEAVCPDLLRLGLLSEVGTDAATVKEQSPWVSFHHKSLQDYSSSRYIAETLEDSPNMKETNF